MLKKLFLHTSIFFISNNIFRYNNGPDWQIDQWEAIVGSPAGVSFKKCMTQNKRALELKRGKQRQRKSVKKTSSMTLTKNVDYGKMAEQPPLSEIEYISERERFLKQLKVPKQKFCL